MKKIDLLVAEIGSTTTIVNAFNINSEPKFVGQGQGATTVLEGDVNIGLKSAIEDLCKNIDENDIDYNELIATCSAAGGLRMTVHGLVYDMTVRAAKEAALGAGANIKLITSGKLRPSDINRILEIKPNIILIAGGVDYGERDTALYNCELLSELNLHIPIIYAGNIQNHEAIEYIFKDKGVEVHIVENVYPRIDELNIEPTRRVIQEVFEKHIIHAPGMEKIRSMVTGNIMPTPGAVMEASKLLYEHLGDLVTIDVGGATTDIHSASNESEEISRILLNPEPLFKRTVEGDLGVYVNMINIVDIIDSDILCMELKINHEELSNLIKNIKAVPSTELEIQFVEKLTLYASKIALKRHSGKLKHIYGPSGKKTIAEGKDLTSVKYLIATGGPLTRLPNRESILKQIIKDSNGLELLPPSDAKIFIDRDYIMASLGVMSKKYPEIALSLLKKSLNLDIGLKEEM